MSNAFDPFIGSEKQTTRRRSLCKIMLGGFDVTKKVEPHLLSVTVMQNVGGSYDECHLELDDRDGRLPMPPLGETLTVDLGWQTEGMYRMFDGEVKDPESSFGRRRGGRRFTVMATGDSSKSGGKSPIQFAMGEGAPHGKTEGKQIPFPTFFKRVAQIVGMTGKVHPFYTSMTRDYWAMMNESFYHYGLRMQNEVGGHFHVSGKQATFTKWGENVDGGSFAGITALWGPQGNLLQWRITPAVSRAQWQASNSQYYDEQLAMWKKVTKGMKLPIPFNPSRAILGIPQPAPNSRVADQLNGGGAFRATMKTTSGWVLINGEPTARPHAPLTIIGARPGVDGGYRALMVEHTYGRGTGFVTRIEVIAESLYEGAGGWPKSPAKTWNTGADPITPIPYGPLPNDYTGPDYNFPVQSAGADSPDPNQITGTQTLRDNSVVTNYADGSQMVTHPDGSEDWTP